VISRVFARNGTSRVLQSISRDEEEARDDDIQVHQVRSLADLEKPGVPKPAWMVVMAKKRRKTLMVCIQCHGGIHPGESA
jgi:AI2M/AI1M-like HNH endonuclease